MNKLLIVGLAINLSQEVTYKEYNVCDKARSKADEDAEKAMTAEEKEAKEKKDGEELLEHCTAEESVHIASALVAFATTYGTDENCIKIATALAADSEDAVDVTAMEKCTTAGIDAVKKSLKDAGVKDGCSTWMADKF